MSDGLGDKSNERRGFLKKVAAISGALPFTQGLGSGVALASLTAAQPAAAADAAADAAAQVNAVVGYNSLSPDEAAFAPPTAWAPACREPWAVSPAFSPAFATAAR
jgi:hypothetical protein